MMTLLLFAAMAAGQVDNPAVVVSDAIEQRDVAYDTLAAGEAQAAVERLEALRAENPDDPALLINLGSAYAELQQLDRAEAMFRAAAASQVRYQLELADGSWVDSRRAAQTALRQLRDRAVALN
ncbi:tetratricopeptide repeat protein [Altererythrobacter buctensis]|uniref:Tetratricopeptide repeat protein n=2 Tax=Alteraurantiacibacter buctensis TaxID=1503981 RepID=A0A844YWE6_9SPHN|nr:tetratricopeptide repeat protein [Alteraurantiacibacter buctensis]